MKVERYTRLKVEIDAGTKERISTAEIDMANIVTERVHKEPHFVF